jgi:uncharacterized membrane protein (DUF485 family)
VWFGALFGKIWQAALEQHGVKIEKPTSQVMVVKSLQTFILNLVLALAVAFLVQVMNLTLVSQSIKLGLLLGICFSFTSISVTYVWESKSLKLLLIDVGYIFFGIILSAIIITLWK